MARMIPSSYPADTRSSAEKRLFSVLRDGLDDGFTVFHSFDLPVQNKLGKEIRILLWLETMVPGTPYLFGITKTRGNTDGQNKKREALPRDDTHRSASHRDCSIRLPQTTPFITDVSELEQALACVAPSRHFDRCLQTGSFWYMIRILV